MGKFSTAARAARGGDKAKRTSHHKLRNKRQQRTPKAVRKQMNVARLNRQQEMEQINRRAQKRVQQLSFKNLSASPSLHKTQTKQISRNQRNKFNRQNKKIKKQKEKQKQKDAPFDFTSYDRNTPQPLSSSEDDDIDNTLQRFEAEHKPSSWDIKKTKLPVQSASGQWIHDTQHCIEEDDGDIMINENEIADYMNLGKVNDADIIKKVTVDEWRLKKKSRMNLVKFEIAEMGENILNDPYKNCVLLQVMFGLCSDADICIAQLSMLSLTRAIIDIMPPYKIGTMDDNIAVKKSTQKVREFEKILLNSYELFLKHIFKLARIYHSNVRNKNKKRDPKRFILARCAIKCILLFIRKCTHFNYTKQLIKNAIPLTNCSVMDIRLSSCSAMTALLSLRPINNVTVECVQLLAQRIKNVNQLKMFERIPLEYMIEPHKSNDEQKTTKSRWEKEFDKKMKKDEKESIVTDKKKMYNRQKVIIEAIFGVYFLILKSDDINNKLLETALCGMAKFTHLINIELVLDLIAVISDKLKKEKESLSLKCKLHCISTTFECLSGRGTSIEIDIVEHYQTIYNALLSVTLNQYEWDELYLIFSCLQRMFGHHASKSLPIDRIASFVKRLINISSQLPPHYAIGCQHMARKLMISDPRLYNMLDVEGGYDREYDGYEANPDHSNALSCCLWELTSTSNHYHPFYRTYSRDLSMWSEIPLSLSTMTPAKVIRKYDTERSAVFKPDVKESKLNKFSMIKHPPKELNNMVDSFICDGRRNKRYYDRIKKIKRALLNGNKMAEKIIRNYGASAHLLAKNRILKDIKQEYKIFYRLLQSD